MKIIITESQYDNLIQNGVILKEVNIERKKMLGSGAYHNVYPSKLDPNIVYKIGGQQTVNSWYEIFKNNPDIFPKVYKRGKTNLRTPYGDHEVDYVAIEKLETEKFKDFWMLIGEYFDFMFKGVLQSFDTRQDLLKERGEIILANEGEEVYKKYMELLLLITRLRQIVKNPDIHPLNFGFDRNGKIKCLDI